MRLTIGIPLLFVSSTAIAEDVALTLSGGGISVDESTIYLSAENVYATIPANDTPSTGFATAVTPLRYDTAVDVQSRGFAETQCDVVIRGGIFENTGFKVGAVNLFDPQTGHYASEIPIDPIMLGTPAILTGFSNALDGMNSSVGTVYYAWMPIETTGTIEGGVGTNDLYFSRFVTGWKSKNALLAGRTVALQVATAYSEGDSTIANGDHRLQRYGARLQLADKDSQTDLFAGYQKKNYGWPGMYTGNEAYDEGEIYETTLIVLNHTQEYGEGSTWSFGSYFRQHLDDYELKRSIPGYFRPYRHETKVSDAALEGTHNFSEDCNLEWRAEAAADSIESTDLTYARFMSRSYYKTSAVLGKETQLGTGVLKLQAGASYDDTNRDNDVASPLARATYTTYFGGDKFETFAEFSRATEVAGYTAIGSKPGLASFAGNADLPRERADNYETGASYSIGSVKFGGNVFYRNHYDLTDWTYDSDQPKIFRSASAMNLTVVGVETYAQWKPSDKISLAIGYAWLEADPDYKTASVDASFYAMNFPKNRVTCSFTQTLVKGLEIRIDADARHQERNSRRTSGDDALLVDASLCYTPGWIDGVTLALICDNAANCNYQSFPGSPAEGREFALRASYVW
jgi:vitamin B12 transporter